MSEITLLQFPGSFGLPNPSPFAFKLEAWMTWQGVPYRVKSVMDPSKTPKGKLPCVIDGDRTVADSTHIIEYLKERFGRDPDADLDPRQRADATAYQRLCDDHLYWALVYARWIDDRGWGDMHAMLKEKFPPPLRWFVPALIRRNIRGQLHGQGLGRHSAREVYRFAHADLIAIAARVEAGPFFFGAEPATIDTVLLSTVANVIWAPQDNEMGEKARALPALDAYCRRAWARFFPDRELPPGAGG